MTLAWLVFLLSILFAVGTARSLYDDGSYYFMRVLEAGGFTEMLFTRGHAAFLFQLPLVIALKLGVRDLTQLQIAFGCGCFLAWPLLMPAYLYPYKQYEARFLDLLVPLGLLGVALIVAHRPAWLEPSRKQLVHLSAALLLAQSLWHLGAPEQWRGYLNVWRGLLTTQTGLVDLTATDYWQQPAVGRQATQFVWEMDACNLAIEIGPRHVQALLLPGVTVSGEVVHSTLLDQFKPEQLPHLERYGVDFQKYIQAVTTIPPAVK